MNSDQAHALGYRIGQIVGAIAYAVLYPTATYRAILYARRRYEGARDLFDPRRVTDTRPTPGKWTREGPPKPGERSQAFPLAKIAEQRSVWPRGAEQGPLEGVV